MRAKRGDLGLELVDPMTMTHVLAEVVQAVHPVIERARDQRQRKRHHGHRP